MALIECVECGKSVSDKATACPNCGYPIGVTAKEISDLAKLNSEQLWLKAYGLHYKGCEPDIPIAVSLYHNLLQRFPDSNEARYAESQLQILRNKYGESSFGLDKYSKQEDSCNPIKPTKAAISCKISSNSESSCTVQSDDRANMLVACNCGSEYSINLQFCPWCSVVNKDYVEPEITYSSSSHGSEVSNSKTGSTMFMLTTIALMISVIVLLALWFGGHGELGSSYYRGNIDAFAEDNVERANHISTAIEVLVVVFATWFGMLVVRIFRRS